MSVSQKGIFNAEDAEERRGNHKSGISNLKSLSALRDPLRPLRFIFARRGVIALIILLHLCITIPLAYKLNIWMDEAFTLHTTDQGLGYALEQALNFELQAPLYFVILNLWRKINGSIFFARLFSVLSIALTIHTVARLSRRFFKEIHPGWLAAAVAFNPFTIWAALEIRLYALVILQSALLLLLFYDSFLSEAPRRFARISYFMLAVVALYTQYYLGFLLAAHAVVLLLLKRWRPLLTYLAGMLAVGVCFAPMLVFIRAQMSAQTDSIKSASSSLSALGYIFWRMKDYVLPAEWQPLVSLRPWLLRIAYAAILFLLLRKRRRLAIDSREMALWTITIVMALMFTAVLRSTGEMLLQLRHTAVLFLPTIFFTFSIILRIDKRRALAAWALIIFLFYATSLYVVYRPVAKSGDWNRVASYLTASVKPGQAIMVFHAGARLPLSYYYTGPNALVPVPGADDFDTWRLENYVLRDEAEIREALSRVPGDKEYVWLVNDKLCGFIDVDFNCRVLEDFVNQNYSVESSKSFYGSEVKLLRQKLKDQSVSPNSPK